MAESELLAAVSRALAGRYDVAGQIGRGGMATVYRASDLRYQRTVAIKVLHPDLAKAVGGERFLREIQILARLSHPNILPLLDSGATEVLPGLEVPWYVMPFVEEETLRARLRVEGALPIEDAVRLTRELCSALAHAHGKGLIHRDIKPENILLQGGQAVLADFGIARAVTVAGGGSLSSTGLVVGTPAYMSPEQARGHEGLDRRSDIYSLGCVLYEMLAGQPPFLGNTPQAVIARHQFEPPPPVKVIRPAIPDALERVLGRALEKNPADRFADAASFDAALELKPGPVMPVKAKGPGWRGRLVAAAAGILLLAAAGTVAWRYFTAPRLDPDTVVVLPFRHLAAAGPTLVQGVDCQALIYDALGRWSDVRQVDPFRVQSALAELGTPHTLEDGERIARALGAGRLIWGEVVALGDSLRVRGFLYQLGVFGSRTTSEYAIGLPIAAGSDGSAVMARLVIHGFIRLARRLVLPGGPTLAISDDALETSSFEALRANLAGDSALAAWNLDLARSRYREALRWDPRYPQANLTLAQVALWSDDSTALWKPHVEAARLDTLRLSSRQRQHAAALMALSDGRFQVACDIYRSVVAADSADFQGWFGLGECLSRDGVVVPDPRSPSGLSFRSSYHEALRAYERAVSLAPLVYVAFTGSAISRLLGRYFTESNRLRVGSHENDPSRRYGAFPVRAQDTLGFIPRPLVEVLQGQWPEEHPPSATAVTRDALRQTTLGWVETFPSSAAAWRCHAIALELTGSLVENQDPTSSALASIRRARELPTGVSEALELSVINVRLLIKLGRIGQATSLADSILRLAVPLNEEERRWVAGLYALRGRVHEAAYTVAQRESPVAFHTSDGLAVAVSGPLASDGQSLMAYAAFSAPQDSLLSIASRIREMIARESPSMRDQLASALTDRAAVMAFPVLGAPPGGGLLRSIEQALASGDLAGARAGFARLDAIRRPFRSGDRTIDVALLEARLRLMAGDTVGSRQDLLAARQNMVTYGLELLADLPQAAAIGRVHLMILETGDIGDRAAARAVLDTLWRGSQLLPE